MKLSPAAPTAPARAPLIETPPVAFDALAVAWLTAPKGDRVTLNQAGYEGVAFAGEVRGKLSPAGFELTGAPRLWTSEQLEEPTKNMLLAAQGLDAAVLGVDLTRYKPVVVGANPLSDVRAGHALLDLVVEDQQAPTRYALPLADAGVAQLVQAAASLATIMRREGFPMAEVWGAHGRTHTR